MSGLKISVSFAAILALASAGCGSGGPAMARVSGKVTYKGQPVTKGLITFQAASPDGRNATSPIGPDGSYNLQTEAPGDGAQLGDYTVAVSTREEEVLDYIPTKPVPPKRSTPEKYEDPKTSGLTATVKGGSNTQNFDLTDEAGAETKTAEKK